MRFWKSALNGLLLGILISSILTLKDIRFYPHYNGVDPILTPYVNEWLSLAKERGLKFNHLVTVGFTKIDKGAIVGLSHLTETFREIDIDTVYWNKATQTEKMILVYHELGHSYCNRGHNYGPGREYNSSEIEKKFPYNPNGFFPDLCPVSIMYPFILDDDCVHRHYSEYIEELFTWCEVY